ncbi:hypothetical protein Tco_1417917 [Tanacetum coccineum]
MGDSSDTYHFDGSMPRGVKVVLPPSGFLWSHLLLPGKSRAVCIPQEMGRLLGANGGDDEVPDFSMVIAQQLQDLLPTIVTQVGNHASNIQGDVRGVNVGNGRIGCLYKDFMTYSPKDYDGKGGTIVYTRWIKKMESVQDMSRCGANQKVKYIAGSFISKALTWWNTQVQIRGREAAVGMTWEDFKVLMSKEFCLNNEMQKLETEFWCHAMIRMMVAAMEPTTIQSVMLKAGMLTDEAIRNGSLKKNTEKRENSRELSRNENARDDNKRSRTGRAFATITNPFRKEYTGTKPKCTNCSYHHNPRCLVVSVRTAIALGTLPGIIG